MRQTAPLMILLATTAACAAISTVQNFSAKAETKNVEIVEPFTPETGTTEESEIVIISETDPTAATTITATSTTEETEATVERATIAEETTAEETESIDEEELYLLAHLLAGECQDCSWECQIATGSVVLNRVKSRNYPDTIKGVIFDHKNGLQYACTRDGNFYREPTKKNWKAARYLLEHGSQLPSGVVYQGQRKLGPVYDKIDGELFCYE